MKAFITGGTGFIGSHLVDALLNYELYDDVRCLVRNKEKWLKNKNFTKFRGDLHDLSVLKKAVRGVDVVFHLAGVVKASSYQAFKNANVDATENLIRIAQKEGVKKIVVLSSLAAAGPSTTHPKTEDDVMNPVSMYGKSKKQMEEMIHEIADEQTSITILRPPAVYGPREDQIYSFFKMVANHVCPIIGDGEHPRISMIYVADVIQSCLKAAQHQPEGIHTYFISGPEIYTWNQIRQTAETVLAKKTLPIYLKTGLVQKIAGFIESSASFLGVYPVINREKAKEMVLEWTCSFEKAQKELDFVPSYSLYEGISRTIRWYKKHHWL